MIFDNSLTFSGAIGSASGAITGQSVTGTDTTVLSTKTVDLGSLPLGGNQVTDLGTGNPVTVAIRVMVAPTGSTDLTFPLIQADDAALTVNVQVPGQSGTYPVSSLPAGSQVVMPLDRAVPYVPKRFVGLRYKLVGAVATGFYFAAITLDAQSPVTVFKSGYGIA